MKNFGWSAYFLILVVNKFKALISTSDLLAPPKSLTVWITKKLWKILKEMGIPDHPISLQRNLYAGQEATVRTRDGMTDWFQIGERVRQDCFGHPACLNYMQSTPWEMPVWMKHNLESRLLGEMSITSDMQMAPPLWQKVKRN